MEQNGKPRNKPMSLQSWLLTKVPGTHSREKAISSRMELGKLDVSMQK